MASYNSKKNLLQSRSEYSRHYGAFRGVDFSSEHTQVHESRFAYLVNMYKDYQSGQGVGVETIPGFRRRFEAPYPDSEDINATDNKEIYGIHAMRHANGRIIVFVHCDRRLYQWGDFTKGAIGTVNVYNRKTINLPKPVSVTDDGIRTFYIDGFAGCTVEYLETVNGEQVSHAMPDGNIIEVVSSKLQEGDRLIIWYYENKIDWKKAVYTDMNAQKSTSFVFHNRLYILDGQNYLCFDGERMHKVLDAPYVPTTYKGLTGEDDNETIKKKEYEQRNLLSGAYKNTFRDLVFESAFSHEATICLPNPIFGKKRNPEYEEGEFETEMREQITVYADEIKLEYGTHYYFEKDLVGLGGKPFVRIVIYPITGVTIREEIYEGQGDVISDVIYTVTVSQSPITSVSGIPEVSDASKLITGCTIATIFDERIFLSGNPICPNHIFYSERHDGYVDPSYFGVLNVQACGTESGAPITGMIPLANTLAVLKGDTQQDGSVYYLTPTETGYDVQPKIYKSTHGLHGLGCLGACVNL